MYWILSNEFENEDTDADLTGEIPFIEKTGIYFDNGISLSTNKLPKMTLTINEDSRLGRMTDHLCISEANGLVFSSKIRNIINDLNIENIEYFNFEIVNPATEEIYSDYKIANVVGLVDCIDLEKSDLTFFESGNIQFFDDLVFDESKIPKELKIFRISNYKVITVVHDSVKKAFEEADVTGCRWYKPEDYC